MLLSADEKTRVQASAGPGRRAGGLRGERATYPDYAWHGTANQFTALNITNPHPAADLPWHIPRRQRPDQADCGDINSWNENARSIT